MVQRRSSELAGLSPKRRREEQNCATLLDRLVPWRAGHRLVPAKGHAACACPRNRVRASRGARNDKPHNRGDAVAGLACRGALPTYLRARTCAFAGRRARPYVGAVGNRTLLPAPVRSL